MAFDKELNIALLNNSKLKAKILSYIFAGILLVQIGIIIALYFNSNIFETGLSVRVTLFGPLLLFMAFLAELYSIKYYNSFLKTQKEISGFFSYLIILVEISFPSLVLIFAKHFITASGQIQLVNLLNSPPVFLYFLMILLSTLMLNFKLSFFAGFAAAIQFIGITIYFLNETDQYSLIDYPNNIIKGVLMIVFGIIAGLISKKIKDAVLSSLQSKDTLINKLDVLVKEKTAEIVEQQEEILQKNKDITDSINYARRIQTSILPKVTTINQMFENNFILYKPKDIVSGDFYWASYNAGKKIIAAVDCTGHGVPGAFMSMVGSSLLNEIVNEKEICNSAAILDALRERLIITLQQTGAEGESRDGMDIAICVMENNKLEFSGANNPLYLVRNGELMEYKGEKQPIGIYHGAPTPFSNTIIELQKNDCIYLFSDGYADQFGGEKNKKFLYKKLQNKLIEICKEPMEKQKHILNETFENWRGSNEQVDDVLVIGIKM